MAKVMARAMVKVMVRVMILMKRLLSFRRSGNVVDTSKLLLDTKLLNMSFMLFVYYVVWKYGKFY